ncbi:hypothetical protein AGMMS49525_08130 [Bacteroidia bacterium]|nr:hypothetical protein AGMMS49525_08130 [Bacteroidia bacterium]
MRKKQLFFSLLGLVALSSSCATDLYQNNPVQSSEREIFFKTFADKQLRASVTTAGAMTSFTTSAWSHPDAAVSTTNPYNVYVLNGVTVTRGEAGGGSTWDYFPKANWPAKASVDFFAYSPASSVNVTVGLKQASSVTLPPVTGPEIEYTVPGWVGGSRPIDQQEDFMVTKNVDLTFASSPTVQLNFKHALSRIVFKAQNQNKNKTYVIKELALSKLKSKGTLNLLDSVPNGADPFPHVAGAYDVAWKAQSDTVTYKVDLGSTNVLVPYGTGTAGSDYTAITNASNGLMVSPQETIFGAFTGSTPEYGTVAEIDVSKLAAYIQAQLRLAAWCLLLMVPGCMAQLLSRSCSLRNLPQAPLFHGPAQRKPLVNMRYGLTPPQAVHGQGLTATRYLNRLVSITVTPTQVLGRYTPSPTGMIMLSCPQALGLQRQEMTKLCTLNTAWLILPLWVRCTIYLIRGVSTMTVSDNILPYRGVGRT